MRIVMTGASGLVGGMLLPHLASHALTLVGRRELTDAPPNAVQKVAPMTDWPALVAATPSDAAICCLGTTIRIAGSQQAFAAVDRDAVIDFAKAAKAAGARHFLAITSVGSDANARAFYLRTKGEAEAGVKALGFERVDIFRPGLLRGDRTGQFRPGEGLFTAISPFTDLLTPAVFDKYRSIAAADVAKAMASAVEIESPGAFVHENRAILALTQGPGG